MPFKRHCIITITPTRGSNGGSNGYQAVFKRGLNTGYNLGKLFSGGVRYVRLAISKQRVVPRVPGKPALTLVTPKDSNIAPYLPPMKDASHGTFPIGPLVFVVHSGIGFQASIDGAPAETTSPTLKGPKGFPMLTTEEPPVIGAAGEAKNSTLTPIPLPVGPRIGVFRQLLILVRNLADFSIPLPERTGVAVTSVVVFFVAFPAPRIQPIPLGAIPIELTKRFPRIARWAPLHPLTSPSFTALTAHPRTLKALIISCAHSWHNVRSHPS